MCIRDSSGIVCNGVGDNTNYIFCIPEDITVAVVNGFAEFNNIEIYEGNFVSQNFTVDTSLFNQRYILDNSSIDTSTINVKVKPSESSTSTVNVTAPLEPPPDKPSPAVTPVISPATPTN